MKMIIVRLMIRKRRKIQIIQSASRMQWWRWCWYWRWWCSLSLTHPLQASGCSVTFLASQHSQSPENSFPSQSPATFQNHNIDFIFASWSCPLNTVNHPNKSFASQSLATILISYLPFIYVDIEPPTRTIMDLKTINSGGASYYDICNQEGGSGWLSSFPILPAPPLPSFLPC